MEEKTTKCMPSVIKRGRTYVVVLLDRSGSMQSVKMPTVRGYNEQVQVLLEEASAPDRGETFASLVTFNGKISEDFWNAPIEILREMHESEYNPTGNTSYYDALGYTINKLCESSDPNDEFNSYLVIAISDGEDTSSRVWTKQKISEKVKELEGTNRWTFTFIGANMDIHTFQREHGYSSGNTMAYRGDSAGTAAAFAANAGQLKKFFKGKFAHHQAGKGDFAMADFYEGAETADELLAKQAAEAKS